MQKGKEVNHRREEGRKVQGRRKPVVETDPAQWVWWMWAPDTEECW